MDSERKPKDPALENIETVAKLERRFLEQRSATERVSDFVAGIAGTAGFAAFHLLWFVTWVVINSRLIPNLRPFDPYPFVLLSVIVSCEAVLLSTFVLVSQNRMSRRADQREHLTLQISLLSEKEITAVLRLNQLICERLGIRAEDQDSGISSLVQDTPVEQLAQDVEEKLPS